MKISNDNHKISQYLFVDNKNEITLTKKEYNINIKHYRYKIQLVGGQ